MSTEMTTFLTTAFISVGTVVFGLLGVAAKNWVTTVVLKWPTREEQTRAAFKDVLEKHEQYKANARLVSKRAVDKWIALFADTVRWLLECQGDGCDELAAAETSDRIDLIGESARYMQVELYMSSLDANGWERKLDVEWKALCDSLFESIETATLEYYRSRYKSRDLPWRSVSDELGKRGHEFRVEFDVCMTALKALSKEYHTEGKGKSK